MLVEGIVICSMKVKDEWFILDLLVILRVGVGVNMINVEKVFENGMIVMNILGVNVNVVKEFVLCCLFLFFCLIIEVSCMV